MKEFSKLFPIALFSLSGEGEEQGDIWVEYYQNGKMQEAMAKITYEEFDVNKLK